MILVMAKAALANATSSANPARWRALSQVRAAQIPAPIAGLELVVRHDDHAQRQATAGSRFATLKSLLFAGFGGPLSPFLPGRGVG